MLRGEGNGGSELIKKNETFNTPSPATNGLETCTHKFGFGFGCYDVVGAKIRYLDSQYH